MAAIQSDSANPIARRWSSSSSRDFISATASATGADEDVTAATTELAEGEWADAAATDAEDDSRCALSFPTKTSRELVALCASEVVTDASSEFFFLSFFFFFFFPPVFSSTAAAARASSSALSLSFSCFSLSCRCFRSNNSLSVCSFSASLAFSAFNLASRLLLSISFCMRIASSLATAALNSSTTSSSIAIKAAEFPGSSSFCRTSSRGVGPLLSGSLMDPGE
mmetsp:Transcript_1863/g.2953  ORF Transcript_1863/g.2953 Transcript_1863/m.2953 type:complete len:224 (-) Transcript_1863:1443-2114(-)